MKRDTRLTHARTRELLLEVLDDPRGMLRRELTWHPGSSEEIAAGTEVSSSMVRALRNGQTRDCNSATWGQLMQRLLVERYGETLRPINRRQNRENV